MREKSGEQSPPLLYTNHFHMNERSGSGTRPRRVIKIPRVKMGDIAEWADEDSDLDPSYRPGESSSSQSSESVGSSGSTGSGPTGRDRDSSSGITLVTESEYSDDDESVYSDSSSLSSGR